METQELPVDPQEGPREDDLGFAAAVRNILLPSLGAWALVIWVVVRAVHG